MPYETVIGLEVHCELATDAKLFCGCSTRFGGEPNTQVCPVCAGMPGVLPVLNQKAVEFAVRAGLATHCQIRQHNRFDRKNYFYPDLPKAYQISQLYAPICHDGGLVIATPNGTKRVAIREIHMEEDAGKLVHDAGGSLADYNRCGVPLLEIVSQPDLRSATEAVAYVELLRDVLAYTEVSDCKMQEGSLRVDVNLSVRPAGSTALGTRTEMKNLNSLRAIARAIAAEEQRQVDVLTQGGQVVQETRRWDDDLGESYSMRSKEDAQDYKYFPEPDLPPIEISDDEIARIAASLPELPTAKRERYANELGLPPADVQVITASLALVRLFERTAAICHQPKEAANWVVGEVLRLATAAGVPPDAIAFAPDSLGKLLLLLQRNVINRGTAKKVLAQVFANDVDPETFVQENHLGLVTDGDSIRVAVEQVLAANQKSVQEYLAGKTQALQYLIGQCMRALKGQAPADEVKRILLDLLAQ